MKFDWLSKLALAGFALVASCKTIDVPDRALARSLPRHPETRLYELDQKFSDKTNAAQAAVLLTSLTRSWLESLSIQEKGLDQDKLSKHFEIVMEDLPSFQISELIPADRVRPRFTRKKLMRLGVGVPVVLHQKNLDRDAFMDPEGRSHLANAMIYKNPLGTKPILKLVGSHEKDTTVVRGFAMQMAADYSAPHDFFWTKSRFDDDRIAALFDPGATGFRPILYLTQPYEADKIPIILIHGLNSSPSIYAPLMARIDSDPTLRKNFQIWQFAYPTGNPWLVSAAQFREEVRLLRNRVDPQRQHQKFDQMMIVGHSMGGLVTRVSVSQKSNVFYEVFLGKKSGQLRGTRKNLEKLDKIMRGEPLSEPKRVVFIATPHQGSTLADWGIVRFVSSLIKTPLDLAASVAEIATLNQIHFARPDDALRPLATGIDALSPNGRSIAALKKVRLRDEVQAHSIIGVIDFSLFGRVGDGVVSYHSAHLPPQVSRQTITEKIVKAPHGMVERPVVVEEVIRLMNTHLLK